MGRERGKTVSEMDSDEVKETKWFRAYMTVVWVASLSVMAYYTVSIVQQYIQSLQNPSSSIVISTLDQLPLPQIVVCNWNQDGSIQDPTPTGCDSCQIELVSCFYNVSIPCENDWSKVTYQTIGGLFNCWQYNGDPKNAKLSNTTGYSGSIATVWAVPENLTDDSINRIGIQATFLPPGTVTGDSIYNEIHFAPVSFDTFFALQYIDTIHNELPPDDPNYEIISYDASSSQVNLLTPTGTSQYFNNSGYTDAFAAVSFSFQSLSLQTVTFDIAYNLNNLFGDFAGMIGTLCGLDLIKLTAGLPMAYLAYKGRSCLPLQNAFNG